MPYEHIKISRDEPIRERHPRKFVPPNIRPADIPAFVTNMRASLAQAKQQALSKDVGGFDTRLLLKVNVREGLMAPALGDIPGITVVSQEEKSVVLAFATTAGLAEFESRLVSLTQSGRATREAILFAIQGFDRWTPENRKGAALAEHGLPNRPEFFLDVELWPMENPRERTRILVAFLGWAEVHGFVEHDQLSQPSLILFRLRASATNAALLLNHRDVRTVDAIAGELPRAGGGTAGCRQAPGQHRRGLLQPGRGGIPRPDRAWRRQSAGASRRLLPELSRRVGLPPDELARQLRGREMESSTVISPGVAVPHLTIPGRQGLFAIAIVKSDPGVVFAGLQPVSTIVSFSPLPDQRPQHLRGLAMIAQTILGARFASRSERADAGAAQGHLPACAPAPVASRGAMTPRR